MDTEVSSRTNKSAPSGSLHSRVQQLQKQLQPLLHLLRTLYLFTKADIPTFTFPTALFGIFGAASGAFQNTAAAAAPPSLITLLTRVPSIVFLVWANLLIFDIANQRLPSAILEDALNKPSRPLPSGCITAAQTRRLLLIVIPLVLALSLYLGPWQETLLLFSVTWMYNDLQGCDEDFVTRNLLIAIGYGLYNSAALRIACGYGSSLSTVGLNWIIIISCVIFTTEHVCDMKDQAGDKVRGRRSAPLVLGDGVARWTIAIPVMLWSIACPFFFGLGFWGYVAPVVLGFVVALRTLLMRSFEGDSMTSRLWALWTVVLFALPLVKDHAVVTSSLEYMAEKLATRASYSEPLNLVGVSSIAMLVESRRLRGYVFGSGPATNGTVM